MEIKYNNSVDTHVFGFFGYMLRLRFEPLSGLHTNTCNRDFYVCTIFLRSYYVFTLCSISTFVIYFYVRTMFLHVCYVSTFVIYFYICTMFLHCALFLHLYYISTFVPYFYVRTIFLHLYYISTFVLYFYIFFYISTFVLYFYIFSIFLRPYYISTFVLYLYICTIFLHLYYISTFVLYFSDVKKKNSNQIAVINFCYMCIYIDP
jgi:hypothetical protein